MKELRDFTRILDNLDKTYKHLPNKAATIAVNFSKERFRESAWLDQTKDSWKKRKYNERGRRGNRKVLVDSGALKRSIRKLVVTQNYARIAAGGTGIKYAQIHNEGGRVKGTFNVPTHKRKGFTRKRKGRSEKVKPHIVKAHTRKVNFIMPKRQYFGLSQVQDKRIELMMSADILKAIKE